MSEIGYIIELLIKTKQYADSGKPLVANQGQAMDGYTELAEYRSLIDRLSAEIASSPKAGEIAGKHGTQERTNGYHRLHRPPSV